MICITQHKMRFNTLQYKFENQSYENVQNDKVQNEIKTRQ